MAQRIDIKIEMAYAPVKDLYFCLYVDGKFITCPHKVEDANTRACKKWLKEIMFTKNVQDKLRFEKQIKKGTYTIWKNGSVSKTPKD